MMLADDQIRAILRAQFRILYNRLSGGSIGAGRILYWASVAIWYGLILMLAWLMAVSLPSIRSRESLISITSTILMVAAAFWQLMPVMMAATGLSLDLKRLLAYPIPIRKLFAVEVLLRVSTGTEVLIVLAGLGAGLAGSPLTSAWAVLWLLLFVLFNLLLSVGIRDLLTRLLARRGIRELIVLGIVLLAALPQLILVAVPPELLRSMYQRYSALAPYLGLPWSSVAVLAVDGFSPAAFALTSAWLCFGAWFGFSQFRRGLRWDAAEAGSKDRAAGRAFSFAVFERFYALPSRLLPDPLGVLVTKELRTLGRSTRFRLVFFMGFTFGILIWLPLAFRGQPGAARASGSLLLWVSLYAALLMGEVLFWNILGFDRTAVQAYFVMPVPLRVVFLAKNMAAVILLLAEVAMIVAALSVLRIRFPLSKVPEALACTMMLALFLLAVGNLASVMSPRPADPSSSWRQASAGKIQGLILMLYPLLLAPIGLAYLARYAFERELAFYGVLLSGYAVAAMAYWVALDSAVEIAEKEKERIVAALSAAQGPIS
ncbi:MAG: hypothetical protein NZR01_05895 [Bryobacteraceae bacterium]|nr:hypothetical protein [Bryobacteraceae bacterium]